MSPEIHWLLKDSPNFSLSLDESKDFFSVWNSLNTLPTLESYHFGIFSLLEQNINDALKFKKAILNRLVILVDSAHDWLVSRQQQKEHRCLTHAEQKVEREKWSWGESYPPLWINSYILRAQLAMNLSTNELTSNIVLT